MLLCGVRVKNITKKWWNKNIYDYQKSNKPPDSQIMIIDPQINSLPWQAASKHLKKMPCAQRLKHLSDIYYWRQRDLLFFMPFNSILTLFLFTPVLFTLCLHGKTFLPRDIEFPETGHIHVEGFSVNFIFA